MTVPMRAIRRTLVWARGVTAAALLAGALEGRALAQESHPAGGFTLRELGVATGYDAIQLPPITLSGELPIDTLGADLITSATVAVGWQRETPRTRYVLDMSGTYTTRARLTELDAPGGDVTFGVTHAAGRRWRLGAAASNSVTSADQLAYQQSQPARLVSEAASFDDLAAAATLVKSPSPDLSQAVLFVPISQTLAGSDLYGNRVMATTALAGASYVQSARVAIDLHSSYSAARRISASNEQGAAIPFPFSSSAAAGVAFRYGRSERSQISAAIDWSKSSGSFTDEAILTTVGYGWFGRKWFLATTAGTALRPFYIPVVGPLTTVRNQSPAIVGSARVGYKFQAQTLVVEYRRATHDEFGGHGGRNIATGFEGNVQSVVGAWSWTAPRSGWITRADFSMLRGPGNFSYIYAWLSTFGAGRQLSPGVRLTGEVLYDRHGSRGFEGFHLTREGVRMNLVWVPQQRPSAQDTSR